MGLEEKREEIKELIKLNKGKRNLNAKILRFLREDIDELLNKGYMIVDIQQLLKTKLKIDINYQTLAGWIKRNIKKEGVKNVKKEKLNKRKEKSNSSVETNNNNDDDVIDSFFAKAKKLTK